MGRGSRRPGATWLVLAAAAAGAWGCARTPSVATDLELRRVVLYRNGVGYFERSGTVDEDIIRFRVRREQVGDFLGSLAVVTRERGGVRGVSFPSFEEQEPPPPPPPCTRPAAECPPPPPPWRPDPMMDVDVEMDGRPHEVTVAYVVEAPVWRPTYRIVLGEGGRASLLQGWAVVQNLSGEDWKDVELAVTEGAPLTFRADLATPFVPYRPVVTDYGEVVQAPVSSLVSLSDRQRRAMPASAATGGAGQAGWGGDAFDDEAEFTADGYAPGAAMRAAAPESVAMPLPQTAPVAPPPPAVATGGASQSLALLAARAQEGGITTYRAEGPVSVPDESSTLIAIFNDPIDAEDTLLYQPDGGVPDSRQNPFRVVRFTNDVGVSLERGPMAILGRGQFLGQGILDPLPPGATTSIPYALERSVVVSVDREETPEEARLVKIVRGRVTVQRFSVLKTRYEARNLGDGDLRLWIHHARRSGWDLATRPEGTEETGEGAALMPLDLPAGEATELEVQEKSPTKVEVELLTPLARQAIAAYLEGPAVDAVAGPVLRRAIEASDRLAQMEEQRGQLEQRRREIQQLMQEIRADLQVLGNNPASQELKERLTRNLEEQTAEYQRLTAQIVEINTQAGQMRVELAEAIRAIDLTVEPEPAEGGR
ncbi:MAG: DUF4139 domain-containing protein [Myxococcales bacterium]|nr:DUF4139 domain-containing protein [Myxococcales bacterium]